MRRPGVPKAIACLFACLCVCLYVCLSVCRNAQVAVLDTYTGEAKAALLLANSTGQWEGTVLPFGTAFGIPDGTYQVILSDGSADSKIRAPFTAVKGESYIVLRTGVTEKMANSSGIDYPQDLIVFPASKTLSPQVKLSGFEASHRTSTVQAALATDLPREAMESLLQELTAEAAKSAPWAVALLFGRMK
ncbi:unnamed protein product [Symbiodinium necroappetens]|uniref:ER membrane protein complex subunit 7 beta-sandwich domain-containing protein n=1 Tax=Symbiodinium necroappetens TaxID=1628268 RepID=A0A813BZQ4_9DINO|nr:unnamed protein product [Symbiodinium necroappetens]